MTDRFSIKLITQLPIEVDGGLTKWRLAVATGGKNHKEGLFYAYCPTTREQITILQGRANYVEHAVYQEISAARGTMLSRIFAKLVRLGYAMPIDRPQR